MFIDIIYLLKSFKR